MTKVDIFSGFLGAGKTTLIKKLIKEVYGGEKLVLIENEFGEIGIDGGFLQDAGINITEMNSGCICCSLVGDFGEALKKVMEQFSPDRILIEPSGVGKLSDVIRAVQNLNLDGLELNSFTTVADAGKCKMYMKNFGEFFNNQIEFANSIVLSRTDGMKEDKLAQTVELLREHNKTATIITTPWDQISGEQILDTMEHKNTLEEELRHLTEEQEHEHHHDDDDECCCHEHHHEHHHHDDDDECCCHEHHHEHHHGHDHECHHHEDEEGHPCHGHHHDHDDDDDECCCHEHHHEHHHHHHDDDDECCCHEHEHHHEHDEECTCGCHDHEHHHHHHADDVFTSWGAETAKKFSASDIEAALEALDSGKFGAVLRAKGIVAASDGTWLHFDFVPGEKNIRTGSAAVIGRLCVIGSKIDEAGIKELFGI